MHGQPCYATYCPAVCTKLDERWVIAPCTLAVWDYGRLTLQSPRSVRQFHSEYIDSVALLHSFAQPRTAIEVAAEQNLQPDMLLGAIRQLADAGLLVRDEDLDANASQGWDAVTLAFHSVTRGRQPILATSSVCPVLARIPLVSPEASPRSEVLDMLSKRQSGRRWGAKPIPLETLSSLLNSCAGIYEVNGKEHRAYPSGGGGYTLDLYLAVAATAVTGIGGGLYRYDPQTYALDSMCDSADAVLPIRVSAGRSCNAEPPPICVIVTSRIVLQRRFYGELAYSLVMKEVGCLFQTLYLVATQLNMSACALGCGTEDALFARLSGADGFTQPIVGEFALGGGVAFPRIDGHSRKV